MIMHRKNLVIMVCCLSYFIYFAQTISAGEYGHYYPGVISVRDVVMPPKGVYLIWYNPYIFSDTYKQPNGSTLDNVTVSGSKTKTIDLKGGSIDLVLDGTLSADIDVKLDAFTTQPIVTWVTGLKFLGADYGVFIAPSFGYTRLKASVNTTGTGTIKFGPVSKPVAGSTQADFKDDKTGFGDLLVQPVWLGWHRDRFDIAASYGFFAPVGDYNKNDNVNIGLGYWTQQLQANGVFYLTKNKATAIMGQVTYGYNSLKSGYSLRPGQTIDLDYGISQYVHPRVELAVSGYNHWQITDDTGSDATSSAHDRIGGVGPQVSLWAIPKKCDISLRYMWEYGGVDHFQGNLATANFTWIF